MINLMGDRFSLNPVDCSLDLEFALAPPVVMQRSPEPLRALGFTAARTDDFFNGDGCRRQNGFELIDHFSEIHA